MTPIIGVFRALRLSLHLAYGLTIALVFPLFGTALRRSILQRWSVELLTILNVRLKFTARAPLPQSGIIVSNHISWLDIFVLNAVVPMRFVAKSEVRHWPLIGWLCARADTLFIKRGRASDAARINRQIVQLLQQGECLAVFPEGTTTDGAQVGHFHASLLQPAIDADARLYPFAIRYHDTQDKHHTAAAYIDDISFQTSLWNILCCRDLHVHLAATPALSATGLDRRTLTRKAHQQISSAIASMHTPSGSSRQREENFQSLYAMLLIPPLDKPQTSHID